VRFKVQPEDFIVEELAQLPLSSGGDYAIIRVEKQKISTLQVQYHIAAQLGLRSRDVQAPALKDKNALAVQHLHVRGTVPDHLEGPGYQARFIGRSHRPLRPSDLTGNRFMVVLRDLSIDEAHGLDAVAREIRQEGLPNYFDKQRFGSYCSHPKAPDPFIGKTILRRDAEGAVRAYLSYPFAGDPKRVRAFKAVARRRWEEWQFLLDRAPRPSNYRSVLTYLKDHPRGYRKALNLIPRRLLSLYLVAYQSYLWNRIVGGLLARRIPGTKLLPGLYVVDLKLPFYQQLADELVQELRGLAIHLPGHRAVYSDPGLRDVVHHVLGEEGLQLNDLKARILKRAYLPKGRRSLLLQPTDLVVGHPQSDDRFPGRQAVPIRFSLPRGSYATLVLKRLGWGGGQQSSTEQRA
jgi:tRNA pseudouridine13 synthase